MPHFIAEHLQQSKLITANRFTFQNSLYSEDIWWNNVYTNKNNNWPWFFHFLHLRRACSTQGQLKLRHLCSTKYTLFHKAYQE